MYLDGSFGVFVLVEGDGRDGLCGQARSAGAPWAGPDVTLWWKILMPVLFWGMDLGELRFPGYWL
jgi:hypothetical protein